MTKEQAHDLAARIRLQLPFHVITVQESAGKQHTAYRWFIAIQRGPDDDKMLLIHSALEWEQALLSWDILRD